MGTFFNFLGKLRKCSDTTFSNTFGASEPSKSIDFSIHFPSNFHVFSEPLSNPSKIDFGRPKVPVYAQRHDFGMIYDSPRVPTSTLQIQFPARWLEKCTFFFVAQSFQFINFLWTQGDYYPRLSLSKQTCVPSPL